MNKTTRLMLLIDAFEILVMPGALDPISAKLIEEAGFDAVQASGLGISAAHMSLPDASILSMREVAERTAAIAGAVNAWYTVQAIEAAGAAGINLEDKVILKRCRNLDGKEIIPVTEMAGKVEAATDAQRDPDFVFNARIYALAFEGIDATIDRARTYFSAGTTIVFVDGVDCRDTIARLSDSIGGPLTVNIVEGGKTPLHLTFRELEKMGVARVSLPVSLLLASIHAIRSGQCRLRDHDGTGPDPEVFADISDTHRLVGMNDVYDLERRFLDPDHLTRKYLTINSEETVR